MHRILLTFLLCLVLGSPVGALVHMPTGEFRETAEDMRVKVRNGHVVIARAWQADDLNKGLYRWHPNAAWDDLAFDMDVIDNVPKTIKRAGAKFLRSGNDVYVFDRRYFIRAIKDGNDVTTGWRWNDRLGNWITYAADGRIGAYGNRNGVTVTFVRDAQQRVSELRDANDALILTYAWTDGRLTSITDRANRSVTYHYTGDHLTSVTDVLGHTWSYGYAGGLLTTLTDPEDRTTTITYNGNRVVRVTDPETHQTNYSYDYDRVARSFTVVIRTPENRRTERRYDADGRLRFEQVGDRVTTQLAKDGDFVELSTDERGGITRLELDANRHPVKVVRPDGTSTSSRYDGTFGNLLEHTDERGIQSSYAYDSAGRMLRRSEAVGTPEERVTTFAYDAHGQLLGQTIKGATVAEDIDTSYTYDAFGNVETETDAEGRVTRFTHHVTGTVVTRTDPRENTWTTTPNAAGWIVGNADPLGHTTVTVFDAVGNVTSVSSPLGHATTYEYDGLNRITKTIDPLDGETVVTYTPDGLRETETDPLGGVTTFGYDTDARLRSITDPVGNVTAFEYAAAGSGLDGHLIATVYPTYREEYRYDPRGNRTQTVQILPGTPEQRIVTTNGYDAAGNRTAEIDAEGRSTLYRYDVLSRLVEIVDAAAGVTRYGYDRLDNRSSIIDGNGNTHLIEHDKTGMPRNERRPMGQTFTFTHDGARNLVGITDARGLRTEYVHDAANRHVSTRYFAEGEALPSYTASFTHDDDDRLTGYEDGTTSAVYEFDDLDRRTSEAVDYGDFVWVQTSTYDAAGRKRSNSSSVGPTIGYDYDASGRLTTIEMDDGNISFSDFAWTRPRRIDYPDGTRKTLAYDALQRVVATRHAGPDDITLSSAAYRHDLVGNVVENITDHGTYRYAYDAADRLVEADYPNGATNSAIDDSFQSDTFPFADDRYTYDAAGNRLTDVRQSATQVWQYNANNQLLSSGRHTFEYNANGGLAIRRDADTTAVLQRYTYDNEDRMREVRDGSGGLVASYYYDPFGKRLSKTLYPGAIGYTGGGLPETRYALYSDEGFVSEVTPVGIPGAMQIFQPGAPFGTGVSALFSSGSGTVARSDSARGDPTRLPTFQGGAMAEVRTTTFGETRASLPLQLVTYSLPGQTIDAETGLAYNLQRSYDPATGRYVSEDPLGFRGGVNLYLYGYNSPENYIDPTGEIAWGVIFVAADLLIQVAVEGKSLECIDWTRAALSAVGGGLVRGLLSKAFTLKRGSHTWSATQKWYQKYIEKYDGKNFHAHHWLIPRNGIGRAVPDAIKNQPWNLHIIPAKLNMQLGARWGPNYLAKGSPPWAREVAAGSVAGAGSLFVPEEESCACP